MRRERGEAEGIEGEKLLLVLRDENKKLTKGLRNKKEKENLGKLIWSSWVKMCIRKIDQIIRERLG